MRQAAHVPHAGDVIVRPRRNHALPAGVRMHTAHARRVRASLPKRRRVRLARVPALEAAVVAARESDVHLHVPHGLAATPRARGSIC